MNINLTDSRVFSMGSCCTTMLTTSGWKQVRFLRTPHKISTGILALFLSFIFLGKPHDQIPKYIIYRSFFLIVKLFFNTNRLEFILGSFKPCLSPHFPFSIQTFFIFFFQWSTRDFLSPLKYIFFCMQIIPTGLNHDPKLPEDHPRMAKCRTHENDSSIRGLFLAKYYFFYFFFAF